MSHIGSSVMTVPRRGRARVYGWVVLGVAALAMVGTLPGRTQGLGLITEPLIRDLGLSRVAYAQVNLVATLIGALFCIGVGRMIDRLGSRLVLTVTAVALGLTVLAMSQASSLIGLVVFVTLTRGFGQSALSVVSLAMVGKWFRRRLTVAMAIYALVMSIGFMVAFPLVGAVVQSAGWRIAWASIGLALLVVLAPVAWWLDRSSPETIGANLDGDPLTVASEAAEAKPDAKQWTLGETLRSPAFWVFAMASSVYGLVASGIGLLNESILAERGFAPDIYYTRSQSRRSPDWPATSRPVRLRRRVSLRAILIVAMVVLAAGLAALAHVSDSSAGDGAGGRDGNRGRLRHRGVLQFLGSRVRTVAPGTHSGGGAGDDGARVRSGAVVPGAMGGADWFVRSRVLCARRHHRGARRSRMRGAHSRGRTTPAQRSSGG